MIIMKKYYYTLQKIEILSTNPEHKEFIKKGIEYSDSLLKDVNKLFEYSMENKMNKAIQYIKKETKSLPASNSYFNAATPIKCAEKISSSWLRYWLFYDFICEGFYALKKVHKLKLNKLVSLSHNSPSQLTKLLLWASKNQSKINLTTLERIKKEKEIKKVLEAIMGNKITYFLGEEKPWAAAKNLFISANKIKINSKHNASEWYKNVLWAEEELRKYNSIILKKVGKMMNKFNFNNFKEVFKTASENSKELLGIAASPGEHTGKAKTVLSQKDIFKIKEGDVMVCFSTYAELLPAIMKAGAIVTESGGILSHAAIVARELKKPCVTGVEKATEKIKEGEKVKVNGWTGKIKLLSF